MKTSALTIIISSPEVSAKGVRADRILSQKEGLPSRSQLKEWFSESLITRLGKPLRPSSLVYPGDEIKIYTPEKKASHLRPKKMPLIIFHEDEDLIVLYKPKGLSMHPGASRAEQVTLVHGLLAHTNRLSSPELNHPTDPIRPGIIHRLDKDTEGIVVVAKNNETHEKIARQFANREIDRAYWALTWGKFPKEMTIEAPIGRNPRDRKKMAVTRSGKPSKTTVRLLQYFDEGYSWVECKLFSGRTHQIRVHLSSKGYPLLGDLVYSRKRRIDWSLEKEEAFKNLNGQALVAFRLGFIHPRTHQKLLFESEKPKWLKTFLKV